MKSDLNIDEKRQFLEDGFVIIRNAVSGEAVKEAKDLIGTMVCCGWIQNENCPMEVIPASSVLP